MSDFQTPPLAEPIHTVTGSMAVASMAEILPLMMAGPMDLARRPPKVAESIVIDVSAAKSDMLERTRITRNE